MVFLGQLTMVETAKLTERLARYVMLKLVFIGAVTTPTMAELVMWFTWCDDVPLPLNSHSCLLN
jgi:hypothetical protein